MNIHIRFISKYRWNNLKMNLNEPIFKLQIITFLDSICYGLLYPFFSPYILSIGGNHLTVGIAAAVMLICQLLSAEVVGTNTKIHGKLYSLYSILTAALISHLLLILTNSCWFTIFARCIYSLSNQSQHLCNDLLLERTQQDYSEAEKSYTRKMFSILSASGYVIGPIIAGCLFTIGFTLIGLLATILTLINICLVMTLFKDAQVSPQKEEDLSVGGNYAEMTNTIIHFNSSDYQTNWDIISLKFLFISSITIFFSKFSQIIKHNLEADSIMIGIVSSYINFVSFCAIHMISKSKEHYKNYDKIETTEFALVLFVFSIFIACYSFTYMTYLLMCISAIVAKCYINEMWNDLFISRKNDSLMKINNSITYAAGLTSPVLFGIACDLIGHHAVVLFTVVPIVTSIFILERYTKPLMQTKFKED